MYDTVKGLIGLGIKMQLNIIKIQSFVIELENYGVPFSRTEEVKFTKDLLEVIHWIMVKVYRRVAAADRTGHKFYYTVSTMSKT